MRRDHTMKLERTGRRSLVDALAAFEEAGRRDLAQRCRALLRRVDVECQLDDELDDGPTEPFVRDHVLHATRMGLSTD